MDLSESFEDYLEAIYVLETKGMKIKSVEISKMLNVSKPAVTKAMNELLNKGYIIKTPYSELSLTIEGRELAKEVYHRHVVIFDYLCKLGISKDTAEKDCCKIEHIISKETFSAIEKANKK